MSFLLLIESNTLLKAKHKCRVNASSLEELTAGIIQSLNLDQPDLIIELYDKDFEEFIALDSFELMNGVTKAKLRVSSGIALVTPLNQGTRNGDYSTECRPGKATGEHTAVPDVPAAPTPPPGANPNLLTSESQTSEPTFNEPQVGDSQHDSGSDHDSGSGLTSEDFNGNSPPSEGESLSEDESQLSEDFNPQHDSDGDGDSATKMEIGDARASTQAILDKVKADKAAKVKVEQAPEGRPLFWSAIAATIEARLEIHLDSLVEQCNGSVDDALREAKSATSASSCASFARRLAFEKLGEKQQLVYFRDKKVTVLQQDPAYRSKALIQRCSYLMAKWVKAAKLKADGQRANGNIAACESLLIRRLKGGDTSKSEVKSPRGAKRLVNLFQNEANLHKEQSRYIRMRNSGELKVELSRVVAGTAEVVCRHVDGDLIRILVSGQKVSWIPHWCFQKVQDAAMEACAYGDTAIEKADWVAATEKSTAFQKKLKQKRQLAQKGLSGNKDKVDCLAGNYPEFKEGGSSYIATTPEELATSLLLTPLDREARHNPAAVGVYGTLKLRNEDVGLAAMEKTQGLGAGEMRKRVAGEERKRVADEQRKDEQRKRADDEQRKRADDEQRKRVADEQRKRVADEQRKDEQRKRADDEQRKRVADEQRKRVADEKRADEERADEGRKRVADEQRKRKRAAGEKDQKKSALDDTDEDEATDTGDEAEEQPVDAGGFDCISDSDDDDDDGSQQDEVTSHLFHGSGEKKKAVTWKARSSIIEEHPIPKRQKQSVLQPIPKRQPKPNGWISTATSKAAASRAAVKKTPVPVRPKPLGFSPVGGKQFGAAVGEGQQASSGDKRSALEMLTGGKTRIDLSQHPPVASGFAASLIRINLRKSKERAKRVSDDQEKREEKRRKRVADEQRKRVADEQRKRVAEEERKRVADEQRKRVADEQQKRVADEQRKRAADEERKRVADEQRRLEDDARRVAMHATGTYRYGYAFTRHVTTRHDTSRICFHTTRHGMP